MMRSLTIVFCMCLMVKYSQGNQTATFTCYSCSYIMSSDPTYDIECVTDPETVERGSPTIPCNTPNQCVTKATFGTDKKTVRSLSRMCLPPGSVCDGTMCCNMAGIYPECEHKCRSDFCNREPAKVLSDIMVDPDSDPNAAAIRFAALMSVILPMFIAVINMYL